MFLTILRTETFGDEMRNDLRRLDDLTESGHIAIYTFAGFILFLLIYCFGSFFIEILKRQLGFTEKKVIRTVLPLKPLAEGKDSDSHPEVNVIKSDVKITRRNGSHTTDSRPNSTLSDGTSASPKSPVRGTKHESKVTPEEALLETSERKRSFTEDGDNIIEDLETGPSKFVVTARSEHKVYPDPESKDDSIMSVNADIKHYFNDLDLRTQSFKTADSRERADAESKDQLRKKMEAEEKERQQLLERQKQAELAAEKERLVKLEKKKQAELDEARRKHEEEEKLRLQQEAEAEKRRLEEAERERQERLEKQRQAEEAAAEAKRTEAERAEKRRQEEARLAAAAAEEERQRKLAAEREERRRREEAEAEAERKRLEAASAEERRIAAAVAAAVAEAQRVEKERAARELEQLRAELTASLGAQQQTRVAAAVQEAAAKEKEQSEADRLATIKRQKEENDVALVDAKAKQAAAAASRQSQVVESERVRGEKEKNELLKPYQDRLAELLHQKQELLDGLEDRYRDDIKEAEAGILDLIEAEILLMQQQLTDRARNAELDRDNFQAMYVKESIRRKAVFNKLVDIQGNIRVFCRVRPMVAVEIASGKGVDVCEFPSEDEIYIKTDATNKQLFEFDRVFPPGSSQESVFEQVKPTCQSVLDGYNVCLFAYGQTGSGKTFTMEGYGDQKGVSPRVMTELFDLINSMANDWLFEVKFAMLEIYNEQVRDLLNASQEKSKLDVRQTPEGSSIPGLIEVPVSSAVQITDLMTQGNRRRAVASHSMNSTSSRSHSILILTFKGRSVRDPNIPATSGKLNLIDLAGSERVGKTDATGDILKEATYINKSLSALGEVINALGNKKSTHVPYRNSKLTFALQDSLGGNSKVMMFVNISPAVYNLSETLSSLNFASRCRSTELGQAKKNEKRGSSVSK